MWFCCHSDTQSIWSNVINVQIQIINQFPYLSPCLPIASAIESWAGELQLHGCVYNQPINHPKTPTRWRGNHPRWLTIPPTLTKIWKSKGRKPYKNQPYHPWRINWRKIWMRMVEKLLWYELEWNFKNYTIQIMDKINK